MTLHLSSIELRLVKLAQEARDVAIEAGSEKHPGIARALQGTCESILREFIPELYGYGIKADSK